MRDRLRMWLATAILSQTIGCDGGRPVAEPHEYLCDSFRDCSGGIVPTFGEPYVTEAPTADEAGAELEARCEADPCMGFLSCASRCVSVGRSP